MTPRSTAVLWTEELRLDGLHKLGFCGLQSAVKIDDIVGPVSNPALYKRVGNHLPVGADGQKRDKDRILSTPTDDAEWNKTLSGRLQELLQGGVAVGLEAGEVTTMNGIESKATSGYNESIMEWQEKDQLPHQDESRADMQVPDQGKGCSCMVAVMADTRLCLRTLGGIWVVIVLQPGDLLVWRGDVCHHGLGYMRRNVRVHCHLYPAGFRPTETGLIHGCRLLSQF
jgi:hypothetical protein